MIEKIAREAVTQLQKTDEFKMLQDTMRNLEKNYQSKLCVDQFSKDHSEALKKPDGGGKQIQDGLERRFHKMMQVPEIAAYIKAGQKFDYIVTDLHQLIDKMIDEVLDKTN